MLKKFLLCHDTDYLTINKTITNVNFFFDKHIKTENLTILFCFIFV